VTQPVILTVCVGNICRSPLAERLLTHRLPGVTVASAGIRAVVGSAMEPKAAAELVQRGGDPEGFAARQLVAPMVDEAQLVLTATRDILNRVLEESPRGLRRTFTLLEFAALSIQAPPGSLAELVDWSATHRSEVAGLDLDVRDPIGRDAGVHHQVAEQIDRATAAIAQALGKGSAADDQVVGHAT